MVEHAADIGIKDGRIGGGARKLLRYGRDTERAGLTTGQGSAGRGFKLLLPVIMNYEKNSRGGKVTRNWRRMIEEVRNRMEPTETKKSF